MAVACFSSEGRGGGATARAWSKGVSGGGCGSCLEWGRGLWSERGVVVAMACVSSKGGGGGTPSTINSQHRTTSIKRQPVINQGLVFRYKYNAFQIETRRNE